MGNRLQDRFLSKIKGSDRKGCHIWGSTLSKTGYGRIKVEGRLWLAHRVSYKLATGVDPLKLNVLHKCDTPACVNPEHLYLGTHLENARDRDSRGRNFYRQITHCPKGHPLSGDNLYIRAKANNERCCLTCKRFNDKINARKYRAQKRLLSAKT